MQKNLIWIPWVFTALILGILICVCIIARMLLFQPLHSEFYSGATLIREVGNHAALL